MAPSSFSPSERLVRKRLAARLRQRRCRQRKRDIAVAGPSTASNSKTAGKDGTTSSPQGVDVSNVSSAKSSPTSSPTKMAHVYVDVNQPSMKHDNLQPYHRWSYPNMPHPPHGPMPPHHHSPGAYYNSHHGHGPPPHHSHGPPPHHHHQQQPHGQPPMMPMMYPPFYPPQQHHMYHNMHGSGAHGPHPGYPPPYPGKSYGPPPQYHHHPQPLLMPSSSASSTSSTHEQLLPLDPGDVSRTVSRSPSDGSLQSGLITADLLKVVDHVIVGELPQKENATESLNDCSKNTKQVTEKIMPVKKQSSRKHTKKHPLMSTEKTAVAAMLAMKTTSSSDESDTDTIALCDLPPPEEPITMSPLLPMESV